MTDPATGNVIVVNGEIYNHRALRVQLGPEVNWRGTSDTETLLQGYARWGREVVAHLKGMFAFAIYDAAREELFLARDRLGIKPLYYTMEEDGFRAASEARLLVTARSRKITGRALSGYLQWGACPESNLLFPASKPCRPVMPRQLVIRGSSRRGVTGHLEKSFFRLSTVWYGKYAIGSTKRWRNIFSPTSRSPVSSAEESIRPS